MSDRVSAIQLDEHDTVATMLDDAVAGTPVEIDDLTLDLLEDVAFGHKVALVAHEPGDEVRKYGQVIGVATEPIEVGEWVHTHNCDSVRGKAEVDA